MKNYLAILFIFSLISVGSYKITHGQSALDFWLSKLAAHENCPANGIIDSNGKRSYGDFCYQFTTFARYIRKYNLYPGTEDVELMNLIADPQIQRDLTIRILKEPYGWQNWLTTVGIIGEPPKQ